MNRRNGFIAAGIGALIVVLVPFLHNGYATGLMVLIAQNAVAALGLGLLFGTSRVVSVCQASFAGLGAYAAAASSARGLDPWLSIVLAAIFVAAIAAIAKALRTACTACGISSTDLRTTSTESGLTEIAALTNGLLS